MKAVPPQVRRRTGGRSARVVNDALEATLRLLARGGMAAVSFPAVAELARVSKTTVYQRWPTKADLVRAALLRVAQRDQPVRDTGSVRGDLIEFVRAHLAAGPLGGAAVEALSTFIEGCADPELVTVARLAHERIQEPAVRAVERAVARGELPPGTDPLMVVMPIAATLPHWSAQDGGLAHGERMVELVLAGARAGAALRHGKGG